MISEGQLFKAKAASQAVLEHEGIKVVVWDR